MDWFDGNEWIAWLGLAIALAAVEVATVDLIFLMLAIGAVAGAVTAAAGAGIAVQVVVALVVATAMLGVVRPAVKKRIMPKDTELGVTAYTNRSASVLEVVTPESGRIKLGGEIWSARTSPGAPPIEPGTSVRVVSIEGATAIVVASSPPVHDSVRGE